MSRCVSISPLGAAALTIIIIIIIFVHVSSSSSSVSFANFFFVIFLSFPYFHFIRTLARLWFIRQLLDFFFVCVPLLLLLRLFCSILQFHRCRDTMNRRAHATDMHFIFDFFLLLLLLLEKLSNLIPFFGIGKCVCSPLKINRSTIFGKRSMILEKKKEFVTHSNE